MSATCNSRIGVYGDAIAALQELIADLDGRIDRQQKRIERALTTASTGFPKSVWKPNPEVEALRASLQTLADNRELLMTRLTELKAGMA